MILRQGMQLAVMRMMLRQIAQQYGAAFTACQAGSNGTRGGTDLDVGDHRLTRCGQLQPA